MKRVFLAASFVWLLIAPLAWADRDLQGYLNKEYGGKVLTLRRFYGGDHLRFLSDGNLVGNASMGPWTLNGRVEIKQIRAGNGLLEIKARRIHIVFASKTLGQIPTPDDQLTALDAQSGKRPKKIEKDLRKLEVAIQIELPAGEPNERDIDSAIHAVFFMPGESMIDAVPFYWRQYFGKLEDRPQPIPEGVVSRVSGGVSPPRVTYSPDPEYSDDARKSKLQGTLILWLVVDPTGRPRDIQIQSPLGVGLDEKAVEAVSGWKFEPAKKDGNPVAVQINVEVSFRLY